MVRSPLTPAQIDSGKRLGALIRDLRGDRDLVETAAAAGISAETLRKIESGRLPTPSFGTVVGISDALGVPLGRLGEVWRHPDTESKSRSA